MPRTRSPTGPAGALPPQSAAPDPVLSPPQLQVSTRSFGIYGSRTRAPASGDAQQLARSTKLERVGQNENRSKLLEAIMPDAPVHDSLQQLPGETLRERSTTESQMQKISRLLIHMRPLGLKPPHFLTVLLALSRAGWENTCWQQAGNTCHELQQGVTSVETPRTKHAVLTWPR